MKQEAVDCTLWRTCFGTGYGPDVKRRWEDDATKTAQIVKS
jgi:hypothetical protein